jgi:ribosomal protein S18 acetylase RimI-like enzyme
MATIQPVQLRPATAGDSDRVQRLWEEAGLHRMAPDEWAALASGSTSVVLVAEDAGELVGAAIAAFDGWRAYIYHVAVNQGHRGRGLGRQLMRQAEQFLLSAGAQHVFVMVHEQNTEGLALVGSDGYLPEGEFVFVKRLATRVAQF